MSMYDRLFVAFLEEWNDSHPDGRKIDRDVLDLVEKHLTLGHTAGRDIMHNSLLNLALRNRKASVEDVINLILNFDYETIRKQDPEGETVESCSSDDLLQEQNQPDC